MMTPSSSIDKDARDAEIDRPAPGGASPDLEPIRAAIKGLRFGEVRIVIQDGVVVQIDRVEKRRIR
jgi:hypothetical protein